MKQLFFGVCCLLVFSAGCFRHQYKKPITGGYYLYAYASDEDMSVMHFDKYGGLEIISPTVFSIGYDKNFIIAKQHPNRQEEIQKRLFNYDTTEKAYLLTDPNDTIYISGKDDSIYEKKGKYYHISNGWNPPDSLKPFKKETNYFIIDIRKYNRQQPNSYDRYEFKSENDFLEKRKQLNVSDQLTFSIIDSTLI